MSRFPTLLWTSAGAIEGVLEMPTRTLGVVILPFASASRRHENSTRQITSELQKAGLATFAVDLLTADEEQIDSRTEHYRLDASLLARRIAMSVKWLRDQEALAGRPIGCLATGSTTLAAFQAAETLAGMVQAMVAYRGGVDSNLPPPLSVPTLLLIEEDDVLLVHRNREIFDALRGQKELILLSEDTDLISMGRLAGDWFLRYLGTPRAQPEADAKGAVESQMELLDSVAGDEVLGYLGEAREEHTGEPVALRGIVV